MAQIRTRILRGFDDPACASERWLHLLRQGPTDTLFLTRDWLVPWARAFPDGTFLLTVVEVDGNVVALAPLFATEGMVFFLGAGESDYLDFIGDMSHPDAMTAVLETAAAATPGFLGFRLHLIPRESQTNEVLQAAAERLRLDCFLEQDVPTFEIDMVEQADFLRTTTRRSMLKREAYFREAGALRVRHFRTPVEVRPHLPEFFEQHVARWQGKEYVSPFADVRRQNWLERAVETTGTAGWLRVCRLDWNDELLAIAFSWCYQGVHYAGPWSFDIRQGKHCPGHVLLRQSLLVAMEEGVKTYDLRGGDDPYKSRFPTRQKQSLTWGLYPKSVRRAATP